MEAEERQTPGRKLLPPSQKLIGVTVALSPETIAWLHDNYPGKVAPYVRGLVEQAQRRELAAKARQKGKQQDAAGN